MQLTCNLCIIEQRDEAGKKTDNLWLRTIRGIDYLVCKFHRRDRYERREINSERVIPNIQETV